MTLSPEWQAAVAASETQDWVDPKSKKRPRGRPVGSQRNIDWAKGEEMYVKGIPDPEASSINPSVRDVTDGPRRYPTMTKIAIALGVSLGSVQQKVARYDWPGKRAKYEAGEEVTIGESKSDDVTGSPTTEEDAIPRKKGAHDPEQTVIDFICWLDGRVRQGDTEPSLIVSLDKAVRLLAFVRGQSDSRKTVHHTVTLDVMQARHKQLRELTVSVDDEVAGVLGQGVAGVLEDEAIEVEGEEVVEPTHEPEVDDLIDPFE